MPAGLPPVPAIDVREGGAAAHARQRLAQAMALRAACLGWLPLGGLLAAVADPPARWWLRRSGTPLLAEIEAIARDVGRPGIWLLHCAYAFGCTASVDESADGPVLRRTLDWPFPGLGHLVEVARQRGPAGEFLNATWPGFAGVLTAVAPGRFAAAINQAPMRRRLPGDRLLWLDYALNALGALRRSGRVPPEHLLRAGFERCADFESLVGFLAGARLARPAIFTVAGRRPGERAVIEHDGETAVVHRSATVAANAWRTPRPGWRPRVCGSGEPHDNNRRRVEAMARPAAAGEGPLGWAMPPVLNAYTRTTIEMTPARGRVVVAGWESDRGTPRSVTAITTI